MGHHDASWKVTAEEAGANPTNSRIVNIATSNWESFSEEGGEADAWGGNFMTSPSSEDAAWLLSDARREAHPSDEAIITPIPRDSDVTHTVKTVTVKVSGLLADRLRSSYSYEEKKALRKQIEKETGKRVIQLEVEKFPARRKAKAVATEGKSVTVYDVIGTESKWNQEKVLATGVASFPEAKERGVQFAADPAKDRFEAFVVRARIQRVKDDGSTNADMAVITRPVAPEATITVRVTFESVKPNWKAQGYLVVFDVNT